ncbi:hypothetical protein GFY24_11895 [Nocardia sp. SYP-A9097]|uniref:hypothetical protein n=1 Tax=Nocardia sp. SYP-A9097 TaxID=2663237 RepID=UPI00129BB5D6|nr:hypothetical protein [Nocardia sp. SYP-A9097]MRH88137.1 hypothetical protein [Nocardia sp. SYP-A9097]
MRTVCLNCLTEFRYDRERNRWYTVIRQRNGGFAKQIETYFDKLNLRCPKGCELDPVTLDHPTKVIGFVGESASSKSHLIVSMIHSMMNDPRLASQFSFIVSPKSASLWTALEARLLDRRALDATGPRRMAMDQTQRTDGLAMNAQRQSQGHTWAGLEQRRPILVTAYSVQTASAVNLAFIDVAGEDIADGAVAARVSPHLAVADFLWFVVPSTLNKQYLALMREQADPDDQESLNNIVEHSQTVGRTTLMIDQIAKLWRAANSYPIQLPIEPPRLHVSTIVAKTDLLSLIDLPEANIVAPPANWADSPVSGNGSGNAYDPPRILERCEITRNLVRQLFPAVDSALSIHFPWNMYFPVSAVGCGKRGNGTYPVFKPYGAADPVVYMLEMIEELRAYR